MQDIKNDVDTQTTEQVETKNEVVFPTHEEYQKEINRVVGERLKRKENTFAEKLGLESYSDEALESFVTNYNETSTKYKEVQETLQTKESQLFDKELTIGALTMGVTQDNLERVSKLVKTELQTNEELDVNKALDQVLTDFPMFKGVEETTPPSKVGIEIKTDKKAVNEVDDYLNKKYGQSKFFKK